MKNLAAFTSQNVGHGSYVPYVSINQEDEGRVSITVRGEAADKKANPPMATVYLSASEWKALLERLI